MRKWPIQQGKYVLKIQLRMTYLYRIVGIEVWVQMAVLQQVNCSFIRYLNRICEILYYTAMCVLWLAVPNAYDWRAGTQALYCGSSVDCTSSKQTVAVVVVVSSHHNKYANGLKIHLFVHYHSFIVIYTAQVVNLNRYRLKYLEIRVHCSRLMSLNYQL